MSYFFIFFFYFPLLNIETIPVFGLGVGAIFYQAGAEAAQKLTGSALQ
jgi:hypothetical protein